MIPPKLFVKTGRRMRVTFDCNILRVFSLEVLYSESTPIAVDGSNKIVPLIESTTAPVKPPSRPEETTTFFS